MHDLVVVSVGTRSLGWGTSSVLQLVWVLELVAVSPCQVCVINPNYAGALMIRCFPCITHCIPFDRFIDVITGFSMLFQYLEFLLALHVVRIL